MYDLYGAVHLFQVQFVKAIQIAKFPYYDVLSSNDVFSESHLDNCNQARLLTVKIVLNSKTWGSGILISKQGKIYKILTNRHVLKGDSKEYSVQVFDGNQYNSYLANNVVRFSAEKSSSYDLALLEFSSERSYKIADLAEWQEGGKIFATGFPMQSDPLPLKGFECTPFEGSILRLDNPMQDGYQIGSPINVLNGMSGGPTLNEKLEVVGVSGKVIPKIFVNPDLYLYRDGSRVNYPLSLLSTYSWSIPIDNQLLSHSNLKPLNLTLTLNGSPSNKTTSTEKKSVPVTVLPQINLTTTNLLNDNTVKDVGQSITVAILDSNSERFQSQSIASGVILARDKTTYFVFTDSDLISQTKRYQIVTHNGQAYKADIVFNKRDVGLAIFRFNSSDEHKTPNIKLIGKIDQLSNVYISSLNKFGEFLQPVITDLETIGINMGIRGGAILDRDGKFLGIYRGSKQKILTNTIKQITPPKIFKLINGSNTM